jgi:hypothetical protein
VQISMLALWSPAPRLSLGLEYRIGAAFTNGHPTLA